MKTQSKISIACYCLAGVITITFGLIYFFRTKLMPYHLDYLGVNWGDLEPQIQQMFLILINGVGPFIVANGVGLILFTLIPFRRGETWAKYWIPGLGLLGALPLLYIVLQVVRATTVSPPLLLLLIANSLFIFGFLFSLRFKNNSSEK